LDNDIIVKRFDHNKSNSNLIDFKISYENPTFIEQDKKLIFSSKTNSKDSLLSQVFILDYSSDELTEVLEARNRISNTDYFVLNSELINVSQSHIPYTQSFNVLDLRDNRFSVYHDFGAYPGDIWPIYSYPISATTVIVSLYDPFEDETSFTFLDLESKSISKLYFEVPLRGANININNSKDMFISYSGPEIFLHDLTKYLAETSVEDNLLSGSIIYPNPTDGLVNIEYDCSNPTSSYKIANAEGQVLISSFVNSSPNSLQIDLSDYHTGIYFITVGCGNNKETFRIIKEG
jgi:hypothetical protein